MESFGDASEPTNCLHWIIFFQDWLVSLLHDRNAISRYLRFVEIVMILRLRLHVRNISDVDGSWGNILFSNYKHRLFDFGFLPAHSAASNIFEELGLDRAQALQGSPASNWLTARVVFEGRISLEKHCVSMRKNYRKLKNMESVGLLVCQIKGLNLWSLSIEGLGLTEQFLLRLDSTPQLL